MEFLGSRVLSGQNRVNVGNWGFGWGKIGKNIENWAFVWGKWWTMWSCGA